MPDEETQQRPGAVPQFGDASEPIEERDVSRSEGGRGEALDDSPEARMMRSGTVAASNPAPLTPDMERGDHPDRARFDEIDNAAADEAANDVRRREHSAD